ncbi:MAG: hypothetical protein EA419_08970 [Wenzhouxiangella sp.]|nr:MAG: hypothetical protein EA419_08970 [Wenzhouxiangella sp.]
MFKVALGWSAAVVAATVLGSMIQTQVNLAAIARIYQPVSFGDRIGTTAFDLVSFGPTWALIVALGFLIAFLVAGGLARRWPRHRVWLFPLAGFVAVVTALLVIDAMLPITLVAAARGVFGQLLLGLAGALGGWVYLQIVPQRQKGRI